MKNDNLKYTTEYNKKILIYCKFVYNIVNNILQLFYNLMN